MDVKPIRDADANDRLTMAQAAEMYGVCYRTMLNWTQSESPPPGELWQGRWVFSRRALTAWRKPNKQPQEREGR